MYKHKLFKRWETAKMNKKDDEVQLAITFYQICLIKKVLKAWKVSNAILKRESFMKEQAALFDAIRLKIKVLRAFAMIYYLPTEDRQS